MTSPNSTSIYRYYDKHKFLIYVGITGRGIRRNREHDRGAEWWQFVFRQEVEHYATRDEAERREKELIYAHRPPFNKQHNPDYAEVRAAYLAWTATGATHFSGPHELLKSIGSVLPLVATLTSPEIRRSEPTRDHMLRTRAEHHIIANLLQFVVKTPVHVANGRAKLLSVEMRRFSAILHVRTKPEMPPITSGRAHIRFLTQEPLAFRISSLLVGPNATRNLVRRPRGEA